MTVYKSGDIAKASVTDIKSYGAFVSLDDEYTGLIHISEISDKFIRNISDYINVGDVLNVKIIDVDEKKRQLKLSTKETLDKNFRVQIKETELGFLPLKEKLDMWVDEKFSEINGKDS